MAPILLRDKCLFLVGGKQDLKPGIKKVWASRLSHFPLLPLRFLLKGVKDI